MYISLLLNHLHAKDAVRLRAASKKVFMLLEAEKGFWLKVLVDYFTKEWSLTSKCQKCWSHSPLIKVFGMNDGSTLELPMIVCIVPPEFAHDTNWDTAAQGTLWDKQALSIQANAKELLAVQHFKSVNDSRFLTAWRRYNYYSAKYPRLVNWYTKSPFAHCVVLKDLSSLVNSLIFS